VGGAELDEVCRHLQIAESTWHRWLAQYGGMKASDAKRLKELEVESTRLKKLLAARCRRLISSKLSLRYQRCHRSAVAPVGRWTLRKTRSLDLPLGSTSLPVRLPAASGLDEIGADLACASSCESRSFTADGGSPWEPCTRIIFVRRIANLGGHVIKGTNEPGSS
jgi:hypothetical protein